MIKAKLLINNDRAVFVDSGEEPARAGVIKTYLRDICGTAFPLYTSWFIIPRSDGTPRDIYGVIGTTRTVDNETTVWPLVKFGRAI